MQNLTKIDYSYDFPAQGWQRLFNAFRCLFGLPLRMWSCSGTHFLKGIEILPGKIVSLGGKMNNVRIKKTWELKQGGEIIRVTAHEKHGPAYAPEFRNFNEADVWRVVASYRDVSSCKEVVDE